MRHIIPVSRDTASDIFCRYRALPGSDECATEFAIAALMRDFLRAGRFAEELPKGCEYDAHGEAGVVYANVEALDDEEMTGIGRDTWLKERLRHWMQALSAQPAIA